jgi:hypothetical protein
VRHVNTHQESGGYAVVNGAVQLVNAGANTT